MKLEWSDKIRKDYKIFLEPILASACMFKGKQLKLTRSKYIRECIIRCLIVDQYPLNKVSHKFKNYYKSNS